MYLYVSGTMAAKKLNFEKQSTRTSKSRDYINPKYMYM